MSKRNRVLTFLIGVALGGSTAYLFWRGMQSEEPSQTPLLSADDEESPEVRKLTAAMEKLRPLHKKLGKPKPGDWLAGHREAGQTFAEYLGCHPVTPQGTRHIIYVQPLGEFTETQRKIITLTADYMGEYFNVPVKVKDDLPLSLVPDDARRQHPQWGDKQILTSYVLYDVLKPRLPGAAAAYIAFTTSDLWPGEGWNFVFGEASLIDRVAVWSIYRNGDPHRNDESFKLCLARTMKTATHETGHMFSMHHCILYECNMCGCNHLEEADRLPLWLCPECMAKVCWATRADPVERYKKLIVWCRAHSFQREADFFEKSIKALTTR